MNTRDRYLEAFGLIAELYRVGVRLIISGDEVRVRAPRGVITEALRQRLVKYKGEVIEALGDGTFPDTTLPDEIYISAGVPNTDEAVRACIDAQRVGRRAVA